MAQALPFVAAALTAATAVSQLEAGRQQAKGLMQQATHAKLPAKSEILKYKQQGVAVLDNILATTAAINARAAAGGIDPFSGSAKALETYALKKGASELYLARDGETIAFGIGEAQAMQYVSQAKSAMSAARTAALGTIASFAIGQAGLGGAPSGGSSGSYLTNADDVLGAGGGL